MQYAFKDIVFRQLHSRSDALDYWLKTLGGGARGGLLRDDWKNERGGILLRSATFPRRPASIAAGHGIVYYAAGRRLVFAAGHVTSPPYQAETYEESTWPWRVDVLLPWDVELISEGVPLDHLNVGDRDLTISIKRRAYIRLRRAEYEMAIRSLGGIV